MEGCTKLANVDGLQGLAGLAALQTLKLNFANCEQLANVDGLQGLGGLAALQTLTRLGVQVVKTHAQEVVALRCRLDPLLLPNS